VYTAKILTLSITSISKHARVTHTHTQKGVYHEQNTLRSQIRVIENG
jgi:hypothetical protein